jgi:hypothetical protein
MRTAAWLAQLRGPMELELGSAAKWRASASREAQLLGAPGAFIVASAALLLGIPVYA